MKIDTNFLTNFFTCFDEARGIAIHKRKVLKDKSSKTLSFMQSKLINFIILMVLSILINLLSCFDYCLVILSYITYIVAYTYIIQALISLICIYNFKKKRQFKNTIVINKEGIIDESFYGIKMIFSFDKIKGIVVGKRSITILTDTPVYFYFDISKKDEVINAIEKYGDKDKIIY